MNLDKSTQGGITTKFPISSILNLLCQHGSQNISKKNLSRQLHFVNWQKIYTWEFKKNKIITNFKNRSIFQVSLLVNKEVKSNLIISCVF